MDRNQKAGCVLITLSLALATIALLISAGWGTDSPLVIYYLDHQDYDSILKDFENTAIYTKYVLATLVVPTTYGLLLYKSLALWFPASDPGQTIAWQGTKRERTIKVVDKSGHNDPQAPNLIERTATGGDRSGAPDGIAAPASAAHVKR
jgi:hypothetical protein